MALVGAVVLAVSVALVTNAVSTAGGSKPASPAGSGATSAARELRAEREMYLMDIENLQPLLAQWDEQIKIAGSTPRMLLPGRIDRLDSVIGAVKGARMHSPCTREARDVLVSGLQARKEALVAFLAMESPTRAQQRADDSETRFREHFSLCSPRR